MQETRPSLAAGAAIGTVAAALSRLTGFVRVLVVAGALGTTFLANTYQTANTAPNLIFELVAAGVLTSVFVPTFVEYIARDRREEGNEAANALASVALLGLIALAVLLALAAPLIMRLLTIGVQNDRLRAREVALGTEFLRLFSPQIVFYGLGMIMTAALHAHRRFALPAFAPIFNNVVVIAVYLTYAAMRGERPPAITGISDAETFMLGAGTTAGVIAMTLCLVPQLIGLGWRFRFRFDTGHPAVRRGARLGAWALSYAGGYQAGLIVVLILANKIQGGVAAYQWAYTFFYLPHSLFAVPVFNVLFTAMSERVSEGDATGLLEKLRDGMGMLAFILVPISAFLLVASGPLTTVTIQYGVMTGAGAELVARVLSAFALGLPVYSAFLVLTRAYYAVGDTRTPALVNAATIGLASIVGAALFYVLPDGWEVAGLAVGHSAAFFVGTAVLSRLFTQKAGSAGATSLLSAIVRAVVFGAVALGVMVFVHLALPDTPRGDALLNLIVTAAAGAVIYLGLMRTVDSPELMRLLSALRSSVRWMR